MDIEKLYRVIDSCETLGQCIVADSYINAFLVKHTPTYPSVSTSIWFNRLVDDIYARSDKKMLSFLNRDCAAISQHMAFNYWGKAGELS